MIMEEDKLSELFAGFEPDLSSDDLFMSRLEVQLDAVELVKERIANVHRKSRLAIIVASVTGFVFGITVAVLYPLIADYLSSVTFTSATQADIFDSYSIYILLTAICACGITVTYAAYDITLAATNKYNLSPGRLMYSRT